MILLLELFFKKLYRQNQNIFNQVKFILKDLNIKYQVE